MKYNKEQIKEIFGHIWKKILSRAQKGDLHPNIKKSEPSTHNQKPMTTAQLSLPFNKKKKSKKSSNRPLSRPKQLTFSLLDVDDEVPVYEDVAKWLNDNFDGDIYIGPDMSAATTFRYSPEFQYETGKKPSYGYRDWLREKPEVAMLHYNVIAKRYNELKKSKRMNITEISSMIQEIVEEELSEINHTTDSSGNTIIAQGAPGSVARFASENPEIIKQMRDWIKDCQWQDIPDDELENTVNELSDEEVLKGIQKSFDGGIRAFLQSSNSQSQVPIGYKESLKENWSGGQQDDAPDGYTNDSQRAFAHSQATTPRNNETEKAKQLAKSGKYVVLVGMPVFCKSTDACLGNDTSIHHVADNRDDAATEADKIYKQGHGDYEVSVIGPEDVKPKPSEPTTPEDDVPFEGVGYVYDKDMKKDLKHIPGERWRVKFDEGISKLELRGVIKELINEMWYGSKNDAEGDETHDEPMNEIFDTYAELEKFVKRLPPEEIAKITAISKELNIGAYDAILEYLRRIADEKKSPKLEVAPPGFEGTVKAMKKHKEIDNPWALAWSMKNKGYKSHKKS